MEAEGLSPSGHSTSVDPRSLRINRSPAGLDPAKDLPRGLLKFLAPLHREFAQKMKDLGTPEKFRHARVPSEGMIVPGEFAPI